MLYELFILLFSVSFILNMRKQNRFIFFQIPQLTKILILAQVLVYLFVTYGNLPLSLFYLRGYNVLYLNEWYRLISFLFAPPQSSNILFQLITFFFYYYIGTQLEGIFGNKIYTFFVVIGALLTIGLSMIFPSMPFNNQFLITGAFFFFAVARGDTVIMAYFIIPVKIKWIAYLYVAYHLWIVFQSPIQIIPLLPVYLAPFLAHLAGKVEENNIKQEISRKVTKILVSTAKAKSEPFFKHMCFVCKRNDRDNGGENFRYCDDCGECFCEEHIDDHNCPNL